MFKNTDHLFCSSQWTTVPFEIHPKGPFDELVDILFSLLPCLTIANRLIESRAEHAHVLTEELRTSVLDTMLRLHTWWVQFMALMNLGDFDVRTCTNVTTADTENPPFRPDHFPLLPQTDMPTAALGALYDAANIIVFRLFFLVSPSAPLYEARIRRHAQSILTAMNFMSTVPGPVSSRGSMMVGLPVRILQIWCPYAQDRDLPGSPAASKELFANVAAYVLAKYETESVSGDSSRRVPVAFLLKSGQEKPRLQSPW